MCAAAPGRKIASIVTCWRQAGCAVELVCGGDLPGGAAARNTTASSNAARASTSLYRPSRLLSVLIRSASEHRDIRHNAVSAEHVRKLVQRKRPDLIWERSSRLHNAGLVVAKEMHIPYVLEWIDNLIPYRCSWYHSRAVATEQQKNRQATFVVVVSEVLRQQLAQQGVGASKILVAQNAVDPQEFCRDPAARRQSRKMLSVGDHQMLAGYLGSYAFYHDTRRLVLAADILRKQGNCRLKILMVGDGLEYRESRSLAERLGLLDSLVIMKPKVPAGEVPALLAALDIAVLPGSTDIICPIKVQEYMAAELPTVLPDYPANREVITHGQTGLLFTPKDERSLAESLCELTQDPASATRMGQNARKEVQQRFTWEKTWGAALEEILHRIAAQNKSHAKT